MRHADVEKTILDQVRPDEAFHEGGVGEGADGGAGCRRSRRLGRAVARGAAGVREPDVAGNPEYKQWPGTCEIWVSADPKQEFCTVLALRVPVDVAAQLQARPAELVELVARTVEILPPADEKPAADGPPAK